MGHDKPAKNDIEGMAADLEAAYQGFLADLRALQSRRRRLLERFQHELERRKIEKLKKDLE